MSYYHLLHQLTASFKCLLSCNGIEVIKTSPSTMYLLSRQLGHQPKWTYDVTYTQTFMNPNNVLIPRYCYTNLDKWRHSHERIRIRSFTLYTKEAEQCRLRPNEPWKYNLECKTKIRARIVIVSGKSNLNVARRKALCAQSMAPRLLITFFPV